MMTETHLISKPELKTSSHYESCTRPRSHRTRT